MTNNFFLNAPELKKHLAHIVSNPAEPQHNSFILTGDLIGGTLALEEFKHELKQKHPLREVLHYDGYQIRDFIQKTPLEMLKNFHCLHISLLAVILTRLNLERWTNEEQDKLAVFLKTLTRQHIQVVASCNIGLYNDSHLPAVTPEMWSWYMSGYQYCLKYGLVSYRKDLTCSLTLEQDRKRWGLLSRLSKTHSFGELYAGILTQDDKLDFNSDMKVELGLLWLGSFEPPAYIFPRAVCPTCGKGKMIPYACIASVLSGCHTIKFHCLNCHERLATNNALDYYHLMRDYGTRPYYRRSKDRCTYRVGNKTATMHTA